MSASAWTGLPGLPGYFSGASGTVTLPPNAILIAVTAHASAGGASLVIFGGQSIPIINGAPAFVLDLKHANFQAFGSGAAAQLVFTGTDSYFVHYMKTGHAS
jgi:hypothetical protein